MKLVKLSKRYVCVAVTISLLSISTVEAANTYYWIGLGANSNWTTSGNWIQNNKLTGITTSYPGSGTGDIVDFQFLSLIPETVVLNSTINPVSKIILEDAQTANVTITGVTLSVTGGITIADNLQILGSTSTFQLKGTGTMALSGASVFNLTAILDVIGGNLAFNSSSSLTINGSSTYQSVLQNDGGTITSTSTTFNLSGGLSQIRNNSGSFSPASSTFNLSGITTQLWNAGGTVNMSGCTFNVTGGQTTGQATGIPNDSGTFSATSTTFNLNSASSEIKNLGTFNLGAGSIINMNGAGSFTRNGTAGIFTCSSTSIINISTSTSYLQNTSSNPFTLLSDASGSATIGNITAGGSITGVYNVQRFVTGGTNTYRNYRLLSCPVNKITYVAPTSGANVIDLSYLGRSVTSPATYNGAFIGGPGTTFGGGIHTTPNPTIYLYQESIKPGNTYNSAFTAGKNVGISAINSSDPTYLVTTVSTASGGINSSNVTIPVGNAFLMYYIGDNTRTTTSTTVTPSNSYLNATGYINQGTIPVYMWGTSPTNVLTYTTGTGSRYSGMTMLGNPYPSTIDLHQFYLDNAASLTGTFYELNDQTELFPTYNGMSNTVSSTITGGSQYVASGQGFYAVLAASGSLSFKEDQKTASATAPVFPTQSLLSINTSPVQTTKSMSSLPAGTVTAADVTTLSTSSTPPVNPAGLHLKLALDSDVYDEIGVYFNKAWSDNYDKYDSFDLDGLAPKVYLSSFTADGVRVSINAMSDYKHGKKVKLYVRGTADGTYALNLEDIANIDTANYNVFLIDNKLGDTVSLVNKKPYSFALSAADTAAFSNRFVLDIASKPLPPYRLLAFAGQKVSSGVQLNWKTVNESNYTGFLVQKQENNTFVTIDSLTSDSAASYNFVDQHPALGNNVYRLEQIIAPDSVVAYSSLVTIGYNTTAPNGGGSLSIYPNPSKAIINISMAASTTNVPTYVQDIYNTSGVLVAHQTVSAATWTQDVSTYRLGVYVVQLKDTNGNIVGQSKFIKVN